MNNTYAFNVTFTRADEDHGNTYTVGYRAHGSEVVDAASAEAHVRRRLSHLTIIAVELYAIMTAEGEVLYSTAQ